MAVNFIFGGPSKPSCRCKLKLDDREVNLVFKHPVEPLRRSETPITFDHRDHWVHLPRPGAYPLVVSQVVSQVRLAKVLVDGGSALDIIFASTLESMGYDMTSLVPSDQAFYDLIPGAGSTPVGWATLPVTFSTPRQLPHRVRQLRGRQVRDLLLRHPGMTLPRQVHGDPQPHVSSLEDASSKG